MVARAVIVLGAAALLAACTPGGASQLVPRVVDMTAERGGNVYYVTAVAEVDSAGWTNVQLQGFGNQLRLVGVPPAAPSGGPQRITVTPYVDVVQTDNVRGSRTFTVTAAENSMTATAF